MKNKELKLLKIKLGLNKETQKIISFQPKNQSLELLKTQKQLFQVVKTYAQISQKQMYSNKKIKYLIREKAYK